MSQCMMSKPSKCLGAGRAMEVKLEIVTIEAEVDGGLVFSLACFLP